MENRLLSQFQAIYEKQDMLSKLTDHVLYSSMGYSEIHCLAAIDQMDEPNTTAIADRLRMTRGAASKITKKLTGRGLVEIFQSPGNKKEKYHRLTAEGKVANERHTKAHKAWERRDLKFLRGISAEDKVVVSTFLDRFNNYLEQVIEEKTR
jgi:Transcriptional regulators